jgi:hypothetical protein
VALPLEHIHTSWSSALFGAKHSDDPTDPQFAVIEDLWKQFQPDVAFNEGGNPPVEQTEKAAIRGYGEAGLVRYLAARDKINVRSIDPTRAEEVAALRRWFSLEQLKLFFVLRHMAEYGRIMQPADSRDLELRRTINVLNSVHGLDGPPRSASELEESVSRYLPNKATYKDLNPSWFDPTGTGTVFNRIARKSNEFRNRYMLALISRTVCEEKRVFAVIGGSHVVMQEPAIRHVLSKNCAN